MPCIWMEAGIVDYKLCDRKFDCENCPFDAIMKSGGTAPTPNHLAPAPSPSMTARSTTKAEVGESPAVMPLSLSCWHGTGTFIFDSEAFYGVGFWYVKSLAPKRALLGISEVGMKLLPSVKEIILQKTGSTIQAGQALCWIVCSEGTLCLPSPISGKITLCNPQSFGEWNRNRRQSQEDSWLAEFYSEKLAEDLRAWKQGPPAMDFLETQQAQVIDAFKSAIEGHTDELGYTMQDGGRRLLSLEEMLGPRKYYEIVCRLFAQE